MHVHRPLVLGLLALLPLTGLVTGCRKKAPPTVVSVAYSFTKQFATLASGTGGEVAYLATETLSDKTTQPGAGRTTNFEVFPNAQGVFTAHGSFTINKPTYTAATGTDGTISELIVRCDNANHQVQVRATDKADGTVTKFEFTCTP